MSFPPLPLAPNTALAVTDTPINFLGFTYTPTTRQLVYKGHFPSAKTLRPAEDLLLRILLTNQGRALVIQNIASQIEASHKVAWNTPRLCIGGIFRHLSHSEIIHNVGKELIRFGPALWQNTREYAPKHLTLDVNALILRRKTHEVQLTPAQAELMQALMCVEHEKIPIINLNTWGVLTKSSALMLASRINSWFKEDPEPILFIRHTGDVAKVSLHDMRAVKLTPLPTR